MKAITIKSTFFGFLTMLFFSLFIVSCQETEALVSEATPNDDQKISFSAEAAASAVYLLPPKGFEAKTEQEQELFMTGISDGEFDALEENYRIADYLKSIDKLDYANSLLDKGELYSDLDHANILTNAQNRELATHNVEVNQAARNNCDYYDQGYCRVRCSPASLRKIYKKYCNGSYIGLVYFCGTSAC